MQYKKIPKNIMDFIDYNPLAGSFIWKSKIKHHSQRKGKKCGGISPHGYLVIGFGGQLFFAHRIAWFIMTGNQPEEIDHKNRIKNDNRFSNLREGTHTQNTQNHSKIKNKSGLPVGVRKMKGRYQSRITANKKVIHLGCYSTPSKASQAYLDARKENHDIPELENRS